MSEAFDAQMPPGAQRFVLICVALHSLIQVAGVQEPEKIATAAVAVAEAALRRASGVAEPADQAAAPNMDPPA
jgi:hypothetical protein